MKNEKATRKKRGPNVRSQIRKELKELCDNNDGYLDQYMVYKLAKNPKSYTHKYHAFEWDTKKAAEKYNLGVASELIREMKIVVIPGGKQAKPIEVREYVSTPGNRTSGRGYMKYTDVISDEDLRTEFFESIEYDIQLLKDKLSRVSKAAVSILDKLSAEVAKVKGKPLRKKKAG